MPQPSRRNTWMWRSLLVLASFASCHANEETTCDIYSVDLQAFFNDDIQFPCTPKEISTIETLMRSLVQTDVIMGLNRMIPVPPFYLALQELGPGVKQAFDDTDLLFSQMELSEPQMTIGDRLEDMYYAPPIEYPSHSPSDQPSLHPSDGPSVAPSSPPSSSPTSSPSEFPSFSPTPYDDGSNPSGAGMDHKAEPMPPKKYDFDDKLVPPPLIVIEENSLRNGGPEDVDCNKGKGKNDDRQRNLFFGGGPTATPTVMPSFLRGTTQSPTGSATSQPTTSVTTGPTSSTPMPTSTNTYTSSPTSYPAMPSDGSCEAGWCATFLTRPCDSIPHDEDLESTMLFQMKLKQFEARVEEQMLLKLRKWARDTNVNCLGNSWELKAAVKLLL